MKKEVSFFLLLMCMIGVLSAPLYGQGSEAGALTYFLEEPAEEWLEAFPVGNGTLGGMVYGGVLSDTIKLNEETLWSGEPRDLQNLTAKAYLPRIRKLLNESQTAAAQALIDSVMLGEYNECYLPMGDLIISHSAHENYSNYRRELDLDQALVTTSYQVDGVDFKKEVFVSNPDQTLVVRISASEAGKLSFSAELQSLLHNSVLADGNSLVLNGQAPLHAYPHYLGKMDPVYEAGRGMKFQMRMEVLHEGGQVKMLNGRCEVEGADVVEFRLVAATSFNGFANNPATQGRDFDALCQNRLIDMAACSYADLLERHVADYSSLFHRVKLDLGENSESNLPIDQRIKSYSTQIDPALSALYFQFGRYLLISSSREAEFAQPANLQGIWSKSVQPPWSANWTLNCNAEINYWPATLTNLEECHVPLLNMVKELSVDGAKTAKNLYGARGWVAHHNADIWRTTSPVGGSGLWAIYQVGSAWLCHHLWEQFEYFQDVDYLEEVYPLMRDATLFYVDHLQRDEDGFLVTNPSESFENHFKKPDGTTGWACVGATQDMQIIRDLFQNTVEAAAILGVDGSFQKTLSKLTEELLPMRISPTTGRLQEWKDDWQAASPNGGQVAHGWGLAVGNQISPRETPDLAAAFKLTLEHRRPWESYNCGSWVGSFAAKFWTRLWDGEMAQTVLSTHMQKAVSPNLAANFQGGFWEIDGNLGMTASIGEMFLQSHTGEIVLLPALPSVYPQGSVEGLRARGGFIVSLRWENGALLVAELEATVDGASRIRYENSTREITLKKGQRILLDRRLNTHSPKSEQVNLIPDQASEVPNYWCTWYWQNYLIEKGKAVVKADPKTVYTNAAARENVNEETLFGTGGMAQVMLPKTRGDYYFVIDHGWQDKSIKEQTFFTLIMDTLDFPRYARLAPKERIKQMNLDFKALGWKGLGLWVRGNPTEEEMKTFVEWSKYGGIEYWKIDGGDTNFYYATQIKNTIYPELTLEHVTGAGPLTPEWETKNLDVYRSSYDPELNPKRSAKMLEILQNTDVFRAYDAAPLLVTTTTMQRVHDILSLASDQPKYTALVNVQDECTIAAALGLVVAVKRHPMHTPRMYKGKDYHLQISGDRGVGRRLNEMDRLARWQRIAPPMPAGYGSYQASAEFLIDSIIFHEEHTWFTPTYGKMVRQSSPAVMSRNIALPIVKIEGQQPFVMASKFPNGAVCIATEGRVSPEKSWNHPRANITLSDLDVGKPIGIFGHYESLTLEFSTVLPKDIGIWGQDLLATQALDLTDRVIVQGNKLIIRGDLIDEIGTLENTLGDISAPGLVLVISSK